MCDFIRAGELGAGANPKMDGTGEADCEPLFSRIGAFQTATSSKHPHSLWSFMALPQPMQQ